MDGKLPDLGGAAFLRPGTRQTLRHHGIVSVYLDAPPAYVVRNLLADYAHCVATNTSKRGNYHDLALKAAAAGESVVDALRTFSAQHRADREAAYREADIMLYAEPDDTVDSLAARVEQMLAAHANVG